MGVVEELLLIFSFSAIFSSLYLVCKESMCFLEDTPNQFAIPWREQYAR